MCRRGLSRVASGKPIIRHDVWSERIAESRIAFDQARLLTLQAADMMDKVGNAPCADRRAGTAQARERGCRRALTVQLEATGKACFGLRPTRRGPMLPHHGEQRGS